jgi:hypothetical protein
VERSKGIRLKVSPTKTALRATAGGDVMECSYRSILHLPDPSPAPSKLTAPVMQLDIVGRMTKQYSLKILPPPSSTYTFGIHTCRIGTKTLCSWAYLTTDQPSTAFSTRRRHTVQTYPQGSVDFESGCLQPSSASDKACAGRALHWKAVTFAGATSRP